MRLTLLPVLAALATTAMAQSEIGLARVHASDVSRNALTYGGPQTRLSMWIWSDKYVYQAGETITVKWTIKTNNDLYPYTVVAYRQNNQNGKKYYWPGLTEEVVDVYGNALATGFQPVQMRDAAKAVLAGAGGMFQAMPVPAENGMHTIVVQLRDYTGTRVLKSSYMKIGVVKAKVTLQGDVTADKTLTNDTEWDLKGAVFVKNNATLTIEPGTFVIGQPGSQPPSVLIVTRNGKIVANGTKSRPIVMTSSQPFGQRTRGDWGGLIMLGKAPVNVPANSGGTTNPAGSYYIEGLSATDDGLYGGTDPAHSCGSLSYVRVEYAGSTLSPNNETNAFTWGGCGSGTVAHHLQAIYGADDAFEWFGGNMDAKYLVGGLGADDFVDFQLGWTGRLQYGVFYQSPDARGNRGIEGDNSEYGAASTPYSNPTIANTTYIGSGVAGFDEANSPGIFLRRGARASINNSVVTRFYSGAVDINDAATQGQADLGNVMMNGVLMWNNNIANNGAADINGQITPTYSRDFANGLKGNGAGKNFVVQDGLLKRIEYSDPDFRGLFGSPLFRAGWVSMMDDGFFDQSATFIGAFGDEDWTEEWVCWLVDSDIR